MRRASLLIVGVMILAMAMFLAQASPGAGPGPATQGAVDILKAESKDQSDSAADILGIGPRRAPTRVDILKAESKDQSDAAAVGILADQNRLVDELIEVIDPKNAGKYSDRTRSIAACLLGEMRAEKAAPVLASLLGSRLPDFQLPEKGIPHTSPVWTALVQIGRPAVPSLIRVMEESDDKGASNDARIALWNIVGGKRHTLEVLEKLQKRATDVEVKRRLQRHIDAAGQSLDDDDGPLF